MVSATVAARKILGVLAVACLVAAVLLVVPAGAWAGDDGGQTVREDITVSIDELGLAHFDATLVYPKGAFNDPEFKAETFGSLLERHFAGSLWPTISEVDNYTTQVDEGSSTVKASFDWPSYAVFDGKRWSVYGCSTKPSPEPGTEMVFQASYNDNAEYTSWRPLTFKTTQRVLLPAGASDVTWNGKQRVDYTLPAWVAPPPDENLFQRQSDVLVPAFIALIVLSGGGAVVLIVLSRRATSAPAVTGMAAPQVASAGATIGSTAEPETAAPEAPPRFCDQCATPLVPGDVFCKKCGDRVD